MQQIETWSQSTEQSRGFKLKQQKKNQRWCLTPTGSHRSSAEQILLQLTHKVSTFYFYCCHVQSAPLRIGSPPPSPPISPSLSPSFTPSRHRSPSPRHKESFLRRKTMMEKCGPSWSVKSPFKARCRFNTHVWLLSQLIVGNMIYKNKHVTFPVPHWLTVQNVSIRFIV